MRRCSRRRITPKRGYPSALQRSFVDGLLRLRQFDQQSRQLLLVIVRRHQAISDTSAHRSCFRCLPSSRSVPAWPDRSPPPQPTRTSAAETPRRAADRPSADAPSPGASAPSRTAAVFFSAYWKASSAEMVSFLSISAAGSRNASTQIAREHRRVLFRAGFRRGNDGAVVLLERADRAAAGAGHIDHQLPARGNPVQQRRQFRRRNIRTRQIELVFRAVESSVADHHQHESVRRLGLRRDLASAPLRASRASRRRPSAFRQCDRSARRRAGSYPYRWRAW